MRVNEILYNYWNELRNNRRFPDESEIDAEKIHNIWESCFLISYKPELSKPLSFVYMGKKLISAYGDDVHEQEICEKLLYPNSEVLHIETEKLIVSGEPSNFDGEFTNKTGENVRYRAHILPLGHSGEDKIGFILGCMGWRSY